MGAVVIFDVVANRPAATLYNARFFFVATDEGPTTYVSDGSSWTAVGGSGGSGTVEEITSDDGSVDPITNPTGPTVDLAVANSPAVGGITVTGTPDAGDVLTATSSSAADWEPPATGDSNVLHLSAFSQTNVPAGGGAQIALALSREVPFKIPPANIGADQTVQTASIQTYAAGVVWTFSTFTVSHVDTTSDAYDLNVIAVIQNEDGSESLTVSGTIAINNGDPDDFGNLLPADLSVAVSTGSDLSYNDATGEVSSAAGGNYSAHVTTNGGWD